MTRGVQRDSSDVLCGLETSLCPHAVLCKGVAERVAFASESQARGRGSTRRPDATTAACIGAGTDIQSKPRDQGQRPMRSYASSTQGDCHCRALYPGLSHVRPVRRRAHPFRALVVEKLRHLACRAAF